MAATNGETKSPAHNVGGSTTGSAVAPTPKPINKSPMNTIKPVKTWGKTNSASNGNSAVNRRSGSHQSMTSSDMEQFKTDLKNEILADVKEMINQAKEEVIA